MCGVERAALHVQGFQCRRRPVHRAGRLSTRSKAMEQSDRRSAFAQITTEPRAALAETEALPERCVAEATDLFVESRAPRHVTSKHSLHAIGVGRERIPATAANLYPCFGGVESRAEREA